MKADSDGHKRAVLLKKKKKHPAETAANEVAAL